MVGRAALKTPLFGWMIHDAIHGMPDAKHYFGVNIILVAAILTYFIGFPFLITLADIAAFLALAFIVYMSAADFFSVAGRKIRARIQAGARRSSDSAHRRAGQAAPAKVSTTRRSRPRRRNSTAASCRAGPEHVDVRCRWRGRTGSARSRRRRRPPDLSGQTAILHRRDLGCGRSRNCRRRMRRLLGRQRREFSVLAQALRLSVMSASILRPLSRFSACMPCSASASDRVTRLVWVSMIAAELRDLPGE